MNMLKGILFFSEPEAAASYTVKSLVADQQIKLEVSSMTQSVDIADAEMQGWSMFHSMRLGRRYGSKFIPVDVSAELL